jgi:hypothetical protein
MMEECPTAIHPRRPACLAVSREGRAEGGTQNRAFRLQHSSPAACPCIASRVRRGLASALPIGVGTDDLAGGAGCVEQGENR